MKLNDLDSKKYAVKALKESFNYDFDPSGLEKNAATKMLKKVQGLKKEMKSNPNFYENQNSPSYMKLVFMEQALSEHILSNKPRAAKIIIENEEVEKSQVILAAQDMVDSVQKMIEEVSDMLVKELPALTDSIQNEIGVNESVQFNQQASESLNSLGQALAQTKSTLQNALNSMTGQGESATAFAPDAEAPAGPEEMLPKEVSKMPAEEPEEMPVPKVGREKR
jgi:hypothetical protein